jgi:Rieske 2Fe-2S family protein
MLFGALLGEAAGAGPSLPPWLLRAHLGAVRRVHLATHVVAANWKLLVGNFQEAHHFPRVHPGLEQRTPFCTSASVIPEHDDWLGGTMELSPGLETVSGSGLRDDRPFLASAEDRGRVHDAWVAPNLLTSLQPDYLLTYRLEPEAVDRTRIVFAIDVHAGVTEDAVAAGVDDLIRFWSTTNAEDRAICEAQQRGLAAAADDYQAGPYAESEDGVHAFERAVARAYLALEASPGGR